MGTEGLADRVARAHRAKGWSRRMPRLRDARSPSTTLEARRGLADGAVLPVQDRVDVHPPGVAVLPAQVDRASLGAPPVIVASGEVYGGSLARCQQAWDAIIV